MKKILFILLAVLLVFGFSEITYSEAQPEIIDSLVVLKPKPEHPSETYVIVSLLNRYHYRKTSINDSLSSVIFDNYFNSLDGNKLYFLKEDLVYFEPYRSKLDDDILDGKLDFAYEVFTTYRSRALERMDHVYKLLETEMDFSKKESLEIDRENLPWAENEKELNELWRKQIKNQALSYKMAGKSWAETADALRKRYQRLEKAFYQYNSEDVYQSYMNAFTSSYDPHTDYFSPITKENFQIDMSNSLEGIGARLTQQLDYTKVAEVIVGGPAFKSKLLQKDDKIIGVAQGDEGEFIDVIGWRIDDVVQKIRGPKGSVVRLQILKATGEPGALPDTIRLVRDKIKLEDASAKAEIIPITEGNKTYNLGVITVPSFYIDFEEANKGSTDYNSTTRDVRNLITELEAKGIDGLMIDLRYNGGGSLREAIEMTGLFIPDGPVVQVKNSDTSVDVMQDEDAGQVAYEGPLAVLINRYSASASEIFSGAIQDYKRGIIVGENTFGKGTVQNLIDVARYMRQNDQELGQVKLTLAKFYRVTGSSTQKLGVAPDISFPTPFDHDKYGEGSRPNALPWDEIEGSDFSPTNQISPDMIGKLNSVYSQHLTTDPDLLELQKDVNEVKEQLEQTSVSLNLEERKKESSDEVDDDLSTTLEETEVTTEPVDFNKKLSDDPYLKEGLRLLAELSKEKVG